MKKENKISLGTVNIKKLWGNKSCRKKANCYAIVTLNSDCSCDMRFTISLSIEDATSGIPLLTGECFDELNATPEMQTNQVFQDIYHLWKEYNNIQIHAGTPTQENALKTAIANDEIPSLQLQFYDEQTTYLESIGLLTETLLDGSIYKYGQGYTKQYGHIPECDVTKIQNLIEM